MVDYKKNKTGAVAVSVPSEELFVPEGEEVLPMRPAAKPRL